MPHCWALCAIRSRCSEDAERELCVYRYCGAPITTILSSKADGSQASKLHLEFKSPVATVCMLQQRISVFDIVDAVRPSHTLDSLCRVCTRSIRPVSDSNVWHTTNLFPWETDISWRCLLAPQPRLKVLHPMVSVRVIRFVITVLDHCARALPVSPR